jgi:hypothetical protein
MNARVHVRSHQWRGRLVCGRRNTGQRLVELDQAAGEPELCQKCAKNLDWERRSLEIRLEPKPGLQLVFGFVKEHG